MPCAAEAVDGPGGPPCVTIGRYERPSVVDATDEVGREVCNGLASEQGHGAVHAGAEEIEHLINASFTCGA